MAFVRVCRVASTSELLQIECPCYILGILLTLFLDDMTLVYALFSPPFTGMSIPYTIVDLSECSELGRCDWLTLLRTARITVCPIH